MSDSDFDAITYLDECINHVKEAIGVLASTGELALYDADPELAVAHYLRGADDPLSVTPYTAQLARVVAENPEVAFIVTACDGEDLAQLMQRALREYIQRDILEWAGQAPELETAPGMDAYDA